MKLFLPKRNKVLALEEIKADLSLIGVHIDIEGVMSKSRIRELVFQRAVISYFLYKQGKSLAHIGGLMNRDHATALCLLKYKAKKNGREMVRYKKAIASIDYGNPIREMRIMLNSYKFAIKDLENKIIKKSKALKRHIKTNKSK